MEQGCHASIQFFLNFFFFFLRGGMFQNLTRFISLHHEDSQLIIKVKICQIDLGGGGGHLFNRSMSYSIKWYLVSGWTTTGQFYIILF